MACDFFALAAPGVRELTPYNPGKPIEELKRERQLSDVVKLASNENPLGASPRALEAIENSLPNIARYPDGSGYALRESLGSHLGVSPSQITLGNGSNDVLDLVARTFVTPADEVVFSQHAFAVYSLVTQALGARSVVTPAQDWGHDLAAMQEAVTARTRLVFIANPNNPTGTWLTRARLKAFLAAVPEHVIVVLDEAYFEYVEEPEYPDGINLLALFPQLVVTRTFSKIHGLAGLRIGYAVSHPVIAELMNRVRQPFNCNSLALAAAQVACADRVHVEKSRAINKQGLQQLTEAFRALGLSFIPSVANFVCVDTGCFAMPVFEALLQQGVIVRPVANYGLPHYLRVTVGLAQENTRFVQALRGVLGARGEV